MKKKYKILTIAIISVIIAVFTWSFSNVILMKWRAESIAGNNPYCLQVSKDLVERRETELAQKESAKYISYYYKELTNKYDLTGLKLQAPYSTGGMSNVFQFTFHAVLVVKNSDTDVKFYNWSYKKFNFDPISEQLRKSLIGVRIQDCTPVENFFDKLSWQ